jgi:hypothetical protein
MESVQKSKYVINEMEYNSGIYRKNDEFAKTILDLNVSLKEIIEKTSFLSEKEISNLLKDKDFVNKHKEAINLIIGRMLKQKEEFNEALNFIAKSMEIKLYDSQDLKNLDNEIKKYFKNDVLNSKDNKIKEDVFTIFKITYNDGIIYDDPESEVANYILERLSLDNLLGILNSSSLDKKDIKVKLEKMITFLKENKFLFKEIMELYERDKNFEEIINKL